MLKQMLPVGRAMVSLVLTCVASSCVACHIMCLVSFGLVLSFLVFFFCHVFGLCLSYSVLVLPCLALPCLALPCLALPCLALSCCIVSCVVLSCLSFRIIIFLQTKKVFRAPSAQCMCTYVSDNSVVTSSSARAKVTLSCLCGSSSFCLALSFYLVFPSPVCVFSLHKSLTLVRNRNRNPNLYPNTDTYPNSSPNP
jgi:hypothetical protein